MAQKVNFIYGVYKTRVEIETALTALLAAHFRRSDISVLLPQEDHFHQYVVTKSKAPQGALIGALVGGLFGGLWGWLSSWGISGFTILADAQYIGTTSPVVMTLMAIVFCSALGAFFGGLIGVEMPEYELRSPVDYLKEGGRLLSVMADDAEWSDKAKHILKVTGAINIASTDMRAPPSYNPIRYVSDYNSYPIL